MKLNQGLRSFEKYVPTAVVKQILVNQSGQTDQILASTEVTVFFADIVNFTTLAESLPMDQLSQLLGTFFQEMSEIVAQQRGTIDKYIGRQLGLIALHT